MTRNVALSVGTPLIWLNARPSHANKAPNSSAQTRYPITGCCATPTSSGPRLSLVYHRGRAVTSLLPAAAFSGPAPGGSLRLDRLPGPCEGMAMWNSFSTDARLGITAEGIAYSGGDGDEIHAYVTRPASDDPVPGIVAVHHMPGWDEFYREFSERLARHGYCVICPDLYCRFGHGTPDDIAARVRSQGGVRDDSVVADGAAAAVWLRAQPGSNGKVSVIGTC